ncbi:MAG: methyltransferase domain-containing protein [Clostridia bacterium]|nr:methyltransferase domain-containing protein [Clostridia bacterium]
MSYDVISSVYDSFSGVNAEDRAAFLDSVFKKEKGKIILDIGCGSGCVTSLMSQKGYSMIGCDESYEMLELAAKTTAGSDVLLLNQAAEELDLYGTVDGAYAVGDVINHITDKRRLQRAFDRISLFMVKGSLFVFDINTEHKFKSSLSQNCYYFENESNSLVWQNDYNEKSGICDFCLTLFSKADDGRYEKREEFFSERCYSVDTVTEMLKKAGLYVKKIYGGEFTSKRAPRENDERIIIVAKKEG